MKHLLTSIWKDTNPVLAIWTYALILMSFSGILFMLYQVFILGQVAQINLIY